MEVSVAEQMIVAALVLLRDMLQLPGSTPTFVMVAFRSIAATHMARAQCGDRDVLRDVFVRGRSPSGRSVIKHYTCGGDLGIACP
jgi:hypothetical protein